MSKLQKWISLLLCVCMLAGMAVFAIAEVTEAVASTGAELQDDTVVATINGEAITWADVKVIYDNYVANYSSYYDMTITENINLFRALALDNTITETLVFQHAKTSGLDQFTEEEMVEMHAAADADWAAAINSYIEGNYTFTAETTEEEKAEAKAAAEAYFGEMGYTQDILRDEYVQNTIYYRVASFASQDAVVTDEEVEAAYQAKVAADEALYANDIASYVEYNAYVKQMEMYAAIYGSASGLEYAWYKPEGFRAVKHILLAVDETLMAEYKDLQSRLEEQIDAEAATVQGGETEEAAAVEEAAEVSAEPTAVPITQADVDQSKANILVSLKDTIDEINQKIAEGVSFEELIVAYNTDGGMNTEPYMTSGYEVSRASSDYVVEFVDAAFSVDAIGEVSAPYLSDFGVHIVKYIADVPAGPVEMTAAQRESSRAALLETKQADLFSAKLTEWRAATQVEYTGVILSIAELEQQEADDTDVESDAVSEEEAAALLDEEAAIDEEAAQPTE